MKVGEAGEAAREPCLDACIIVDCEELEMGSDVVRSVLIDVAAPRLSLRSDGIKTGSKFLAASGSRSCVKSHGTAWRVQFPQAGWTSSHWELWYQHSWIMHRQALLTFILRILQRLHPNLDFRCERLCIVQINDHNASGNTRTKEHMESKPGLERLVLSDVPSPLGIFEEGLLNTRQKDKKESGL